jgi:hypothetical protein
MDRKRRDKKEALQKRSRATAILKKAIPTYEVQRIIINETSNSSQTIKIISNQIKSDQNINYHAIPISKRIPKVQKLSNNTRIKPRFLVGRNSV